MAFTEEQLRQRYRVAKLALFNVRLLNSMQNSHSKEIQKLIADASRGNNFVNQPSLLHQGTFISAAYICLVWLWEALKEKNIKANFLMEFGKAAERIHLSLPAPQNITGPRQLNKWEDVLYLVRNALSHGKVEINEENFEFYDQNKFYPKKEASPTHLTLSWEELGALSETTIHALGSTLYPTST